VLITAVCPLCRTSYQLQPSMRGQAIRCPNTLCRHVFIVPAEAPPPQQQPGKQPGNGGQSGSVGDVVPILPAEMAPSPPTPLPQRGRGENEAPSWREAPPVVRKPAEGGASPGARPAQPAPRPAQPAPPAAAPGWRDAPPPVRQPEAPSPPSPAADTSKHRPAAKADTLPGTRRPEPAKRQARETLSDTSGKPFEAPAWTREPPPVRRGADAAAAPVSDTPAPAVSRGRARTIMIVLIVLLVGGIGTAGIIVWKAFQKGEEEVFADALKDYQDRKFGAAREQFKRLAENYSDSDKRPTYLFLQEWCELAARLYDPLAEPLPTLEALEQFLKKHKSDPLLKTYAHDIGPALAALVEGFARGNANPTGTEPLTVIGRIDRVRTAVKATAKDALAAADDERIDKALRTVREAVENWDKRNRVLVQLRDLKPTAHGIREALRILNEKKAEFPNLPDAPEVKGLLDKLYDGHLAGVVYEKICDPDSRPVPRDDTEPSVVIDPLLQGTPPTTPAGDPIVLALARGVLYALHKSNGSVKWARRVGIDTTALPVRVPASSVARERILVLSSDRATLSAMDDDGHELWHYRLSSPCLGRPVVLDQVAYLPTYEGVVHEIELARGGLLGCYRLGQHLTLGGVSDPENKQLYFAADNSCVYVLDAAQHRCTLILYTNHPTGSLRSEPVLVPSVTPLVGNPTPGYLVLNQAEGLDANRLRVYELPLKDRHQAPLALQPEARLAGWTWFPPTRDPEKLVAVSDRGVLGLFGIQQANTKDQALFPMLGPAGLDLAGFLPPAPHETSAGSARGRSQVVQVNGDDVWVLARGWMLRLGIAWNDRDGPRPVPGWKNPLPLGSPLHASQIEEDSLHGRSTLFVVTQPLQTQTCVATAVNDEDGGILWQRQLGLVCQGEPLPMILHEGSTEPLLVALDQGGSVFALDPTRFPADSNAPWQSGGQSVAPSLADNPRVAPLLLPGPGGHSILEIACPGEGTHLHVRHIEQAGEKRRLKRTDRVVQLPSRLAGRPAVIGSQQLGWQLIVPLAGGSLARLPLPIPADARLEEGPPWRPRLASPDTPGHVVALGGDRFLTTDGGKGLSYWQWSRGKVYESPTAAGDEPTLGARVVSAPVVLPGPAGSLPRVCVADSGGAVTLLEVRAGGALEVKQQWDLKGEVTGGPFLRTLESGKVCVGCVMDGRRLVWLNPGAAAPAWEHKAGKAIIGEPQVVGGVLVVADRSGLVAGLDVATGQPIGPGHQLHGSVVAAASPVAFGPGRLFVPLSDGTGILLAMDRLKPPQEKK
jgi:outer membrane protein assembly factor BamB